MMLLRLREPSPMHFDVLMLEWDWAGTNQFSDWRVSNQEIASLLIGEINNGS
jgi:hypothetical protein